MAVWAILAAPFLISNDLRDIKPEIKELLLNKEIIKVDQDRLGIQGLRVNVGNGIEVWTRPVEPIIDGFYSYAVALVSRRTDGHPHGFNVTLKELSLDYANGYFVKVSKLLKKREMSKYRLTNQIFVHHTQLTLHILVIAGSLQSSLKDSQVSSVGYSQRACQSDWGEHVQIYTNKSSFHEYEMR